MLDDFDVIKRHNYLLYKDYNNTLLVTTIERFTENCIYFRSVNTNITSNTMILDRYDYKEHIISYSNDLDDFAEYLI